MEKYLKLVFLLLVALNYVSATEPVNSGKNNDRGQPSPGEERRPPNLKPKPNSQLTTLNPNGTLLTNRAASITPVWSNMRLKNYDTGNTCIYTPSLNSIIKAAVCESGDSFYWSEQTPSGYNFLGWFQFTSKNHGFGTYCLQAGSKTGYGSASNGDRAIIVPCVGDEPTQIWTNADTWGGYFQYKDLGSGKCLCLDKESNESVMWDCNYYAWWDVWS